MPRVKIFSKTGIYETTITFFFCFPDYAKNFESSVEGTIWFSSVWGKRRHHWYHCLGQRRWEKGWFYWQVCIIWYFWFTLEMVNVVKRIIALCLVVVIDLYHFEGRDLIMVKQCLGEGKNRFEDWPVGGSFDQLMDRPSEFDI